MRLRLVLSFVLIVVLAVAGMLLIAQQGTLREVRSFMTAGGMTRLEAIADNLEEYYARNGSWEGAGALLEAGHMSGGGQGQGPGGMMGQGAQGMGAMMNARLLLADAQGQIMADSTGEPLSGSLNETQLSRALRLSAGFFNSSLQNRG